MTNNVENTDVVAEETAAEAVVKDDKATRVSLRKETVAKKGKKPVVIVACVVAVVLAVVGVTLGAYAIRKPDTFSRFFSGGVAELFNGDHLSGSVNAVSLYESTSATGIDKLTPSTTFEHGKPIILALKLDKVDAEMVLSYDVSKSGSSDPARKGTIQIKPDNTTRYITIVTSDRTALESGKWKFHLKDSSNKEIAQRTFTVK